jgi:hypothetical protein
MADHGVVCSISRSGNVCARVKLLEIANALEADHAGRISVGACLIRRLRFPGSKFGTPSARRHVLFCHIQSSSFACGTEVILNDRLTSLKLAV